MDVEREMNYLNLISDLSEEKEIFREFIKHFNKDTAKEHLVATSQDKHYSDLRCENLSKVDVNLQIKLTKLHSELSPKQQLRLAESIRLLMQSLQERESNNTLYAFTNIPSTNKSIQRIFFHSKHSMLKNIPTPDATYDNDLCVILPIDPVKNSLLLGLDIALTRARHVNEDMSKCKNNAIVDGLDIQKEIKELSDTCDATCKDACILPCIEFRDGFLPHNSLTTSEGLLLHAFALQPRDSTHDSSTCTYPVALGHKSKDSMITETTHINDINNREDPSMPFKAC